MYKILISLIFIFLFSSCSEENKKQKKPDFFGGFDIGQTIAEVDSLANLKGLEKTNDQPTSKIYKGSINIVGKDWNWVGVEFINDSLSRIEFQDWYAGQDPHLAMKKIQEDLRFFSYPSLDRLHLSTIKTYGNPWITSILEGDENYVIAVDNKDGIMSLVILPHTNENENKLLSQITNTEIERQLKRLTEAYAAWLKTDNTVMKQTWEEDISQSGKFLKAHINDMTPRQKEYFEKLLKL